MRKLKKEITSIKTKLTTQTNPITTTTSTALPEKETSVNSQAESKDSSSKPPKIKETKEQQQQSKLDKPVGSWSNEDVLEWFASSQINPVIANAFKSYNGDDLEHMYRIKSEAPEFFYQMLKTETDNQIKMLDIVKYLEKLEKLNFKSS